MTFDLPEETPEITKDIVIEKFCKWWNSNELMIRIGEFTPYYLLELIKKYSLENKTSLNEKNLAEILYDIVGSNFLKNLQFLKKIFEAELKYDITHEYQKQIIDEAIGIHKRPIPSLDELLNLPHKPRWMKKLSSLLKLPESCGYIENDELPPEKETVTPHSRLNPLYDYQYYIGRRIYRMLTGDDPTRRTMVAVPTGAGKTRLVAETLIDWINNNKKTKSTHGKNFIIWIAQNEELLEQALSTFRDVFEDKGKPKTSIDLFRFWGKYKSLPLPHQNGIIFAGISMLHSRLNKDEQELRDLAEKTAVIVVDEAHHSIATIYNEVLRAFGFNFDLRKQEISTKEIVLLGLTATPYRKNMDSDETKALERHFPIRLLPPIGNEAVLDDEGSKPHALIDCQSFVNKNEWIRINGNSSYDVDGTIIEYDWKLFDDQQNLIKSFDEKNDTLEYQFDKEGKFTIQLQVKDNDNITDTVTHEITVGPEINSVSISEFEQMKLAFRNLVKRSILCQPHPQIIRLDQESGIILTEEEQKYVTKFKDFKSETIARLGEKPTRNAAILEKIKDLVENQKKESILFFGCSVDHARNISLVLNACFKIKSKYVVGEMNQQDRLQAIREFKEKKIKVLCNYGILTTGFDAPEIDCVIIGRPTNSELLYTQMVGRGLRGIKSGGTKNCIIIDIDDNILQYATKEKFKLIWIHHNEFLQETIQKAPIVEVATVKIAPDQQHGIEEAIVHECPNCHKLATGLIEVKEVFGFSEKRRSETNPHGFQSWCYDCRSKSPKEEIIDQMITPSELTRINKDAVILNYLNLKTRHGYPPTSRMFTESYSDNLPHIIENYGSYENFQTQQGDNIRENSILKDLLIDDYFEIFKQLGRPPTENEIDENGIFRLSDYNECFGSYLTIQNYLEPTLKKLAKITEPIPEGRLKDDYLDVRRLISRIPSFSDLLIHSNIGVENYIFSYGSFGQFKKKIEDIESSFEDAKQKLKDDFIKIKTQLGMVPTYSQMLKYSNHYHWLVKLYGNYPKFLEALGEKEDVKVITESIRKEKQSELLSKFSEIYKKYGHHATIKKLMDEDNVAYTEWFGGKTKFLDIVKQQNRNILIDWAKITAKKLVEGPNPTVHRINPKYSRPRVTPQVHGKWKPQPRIPVWDLKRCPRCHSYDLGTAGKNRKYCFICRWTSWRR